VNRFLSVENGGFVPIENGGFVLSSTTCLVTNYGPSMGMQSFEGKIFANYVCINK